MNELVVDVKVCRKASVVLGNVADEIKINDIKAMDEIFNEIGQGIWNSSAADAMQARYEELKPYLHDFCELLNHSSEYLADITSNYEEAEEANKAAADSLKSVAESLAAIF